MNWIKFWPYVIISTFSSLTDAFLGLSLFSHATLSIAEALCLNKKKFVSSSK